MNDHISFDEMVEFLDTKVESIDVNKIAFTINNHIITCDECYNKYKALLNLKEQIDDIKIKDFGDKKLTLLEALLTNNNSSLSNHINAWIKNLFKATSEIILTISSKTNVIAGNALFNNDPYVYDFGNPIPLGARGKSDVISTSSILIDNENEANKIELLNTDSLKIELDSKGFTKNPLAVLIGADGKSYIEEMANNNGMISCDFNNIPLGEYTLFIE